MGGLAGDVRQMAFTKSLKESPQQLMELATQSGANGSKKDCGEGRGRDVGGGGWKGPKPTQQPSAPPGAAAWQAGKGWGAAFRTDLQPVRTSPCHRSVSPCHPNPPPTPLARPCMISNAVRCTAHRPGDRRGQPHGHAGCLDAEAPSLRSVPNCSLAWYLVAAASRLVQPSQPHVSPTCTGCLESG